jgi:hypothetical protein
VIDCHTRYENNQPERGPDTVTSTKPQRHPAVSDIALALAQRPRSEPVSSVDITLNAKGDVQITVSVSDRVPSEAAKIAADIFDVLRAKYPRENGTT